MDDSQDLVKNVKKFKKIALLVSSLGCAPLFLMLFALFISVLFVLGLFNSDSNSNEIGYNNGSQECGFTISSTSLSKSEFKQKIQEYANSHSHWQIFADYADQYYDYAVAKNVNPELVVLVAHKEGGGRTTSGANNYWGLDCPNGSTSCGSYGSFMQGAEKLIDSASRYSSLSEWMGKYSYIGYFWYNPGNWGDGGCIYAPYIYPDNMPDRVRNACAGSACSITWNDQALRNQWLSSGNNPRPGCTPTTDDDQAAYTRWLINEQMGKPRKEIFGLDYSDGPCVGGNLTTLDHYNLRGAGLKVLDRTLSNSEINELNNYLNEEIEKTGHGTANAVAAVGQGLVYWFEKKGYFLSYYWAGGHGSDSNIIGANPDWGSTKFGVDTHGGNHRPYYGMDCSGFVSWATRMACNPKFGSNVSGNWASFGKRLSSLKDTKPGDVLADASHIQLIVKNNGDGSVIVAEETGGNSGLVFSQISNPAHTIYSMQDWYSKNCTDIRAPKTPSGDSGQSNGNGKILLIAGHSYSPYCSSHSEGNECREDASVYGHSEPTETRKLVKLLKTKLLALGYSADDVDIVNELLGENFNDTSTSKSLYMEEKYNHDALHKKIKFSQYKYAIEIHFNASPLHTSKGVMSPCLASGCGAGINISSEIRKQVNNVLKTGNLGTWTDDLYDLRLFNSINVPFTYLETEFYDNKSAMANYDKNIDSVAEAIAKTIKQYYP